MYLLTHEANKQRQVVELFQSNILYLFLFQVLSSYIIVEKTGQQWINVIHSKLWFIVE